jgi:hypothetical protein
MAGVAQGLALSSSITGFKEILVWASLSKIIDVRSHPAQFHEYFADSVRPNRLLL